MASKKRRQIALIVLIMIILGSVGAIYYLHGYYVPENVAEIGHPLPSLTLQDLSGRTVNLEDYRGKPVLTIFIKIDCSHCRNQLSAIETLRCNGTYTLGFIVISTDSPAKTAAFFKQNPAPFPVWVDTRRNLYKKLGTFGVPALFFLDGNGILRNKTVGYQPSSTVKRMIDALFENES